MKKTKALQKTASVTAIAVLTLFAFVATASAANRVSSRVDFQPTKRMTDSERQTVSLAGAHILKQVADARTAIADDNKDAAVEHIKQGIKLGQIIDRAQSAVAVKTTIQSGDLVYSDEDEVAPHYVTVYDELDQFDVLVPLQEQHAAATKKHEQKSGTDKAISDDSEPPAITFDGLNYTTVRLNVPFAEDHLIAAEASLRDGDFDGADDALAAIQSDGLVYVFDVVDFPLERAADELELARFAMQNGDRNAAQQDLLNAVDSLHAYERMVGDNRTAEVEQLRGEIIGTAKTLFDSKDDSGVIDKIAVWWDRSVGWFRD